jgi:HSP20 family protein
MSLIQRRSSNRFGLFFNDRFGDTFLFSHDDLAIDVYEKKDKIVAEIILPGLVESDIDIAIEDHLLMISAHREEEKETDEKEYYSKEIKRGSFSRTIRLPRLVDANTADAQYKNGILIITMPIIVGSNNKAVKVNIQK